MTYLEVISQTVLTSLINSLWCGIVLTAIVGVMLNRWHPNRGLQPARLNATTRFTIWWTTSEHVKSNTHKHHDVPRRPDS